MTTTEITPDLPVDRGVYDEVRDFLFLEAELLDDGRLEDWLGLLTDDVQYLMPVRVTRARGEGTGFLDNIFHFEENKYRLAKRIERLAGEYAWAEDPPSRTRHVISNIRARPGAAPDEVLVKSIVILYRTRGDSPAYDLLSAERCDVLRHGEGGWQLAHRRILVDQSTLATHSLSVFL
ncbi:MULTISPECIES: 3-phenylpropionate/cinnamic acid dioxygenase subunit beta [unclassified Mycobacterium]|uniref:3-phenylpropionate/cinnamic acid dioxygenase subunit beta n=1 Tax=unclassified Mycobacterium TaxID=2642494 RepID=UPI0029C7AB45|nr:MULTISPECIES: 3-phenylpropionate/cinnamic acid dioxygenase subunit beta [unclassified Mycobacterium]